MYIGRRLPKAGGVPTVDEFTGDGSTTAFTMTATVAHERQIMVMIGGAVQDYDNFSVSGATLTFTTAPNDGVYIQVIHGHGVQNYFQLLDGSIGNDQMADNAIGNAEMRDAAIGTTELKMSTAGDEGAAFCKGWCHFDQIAPGTDDSFNIASVTDTGTGNSTFVWDTDFGNDDYVTGQCNQREAQNGCAGFGSIAVGSVAIVWINIDGLVAIDSDHCTMMSFGDR